MASKTTAVLTSLLLFVTSCAARGNEAVPTSEASLITATFSPTSISVPSATPLLPLLRDQPTITPVEGTSSTQINVRSEPSTSGNVLGLIPPNTKVQIVGKDPGGNWWQILYAQGVDGKGWVTAQYVTTTNADAVPLVGANPSDSNNGNVAIVQQQINVRSGPGTSFNSVGTLNAQDVVNLTGKDSNGAWLQIAFSAGPEGKGWVNAAFVRAQGVENLPIITEAGQIVGTGTPTGIPATATPTLIPAWEDQDSQNNPVVSIVLELAGTDMFIYNGDVSSPQGDSEDWINFKPYGGMIFASLTCAGNVAMQAELYEDGSPMNLQIACNDGIRQIVVKPMSSYALHLYMRESTDTLQYAQYTIKIESSP